MSSIFSKIVSGEIPCYKVAEDDRFLAFLDIMPIHKGHVLVITKQEIDYFFDLDDQLLADLMIFSKKVAKKLKRAVSCTKIGISVVGLEVPHVHVHLIPIDAIADMDFTKPKLHFSQEEMLDLAKLIAEQ